MKNTFLIFLLIVSVSCKKEVNNDVVKNDSVKIESDSIQKNEELAAKEPTLKEIDSDILLYIKEKNYSKIADFIHPEKGVRFSMYLTVLPKTDQLFSRQEFLENLNSKKVFVWGEQDGTGNLYKSTLKNYLDEWAFSGDYSTASISENKFEKSGNSLNNLEEIYPEGKIMVNYLKGTDENPDFTWSNLIFVFEKYEGKNYLVAIINDRWTI
ncbi:hypothetical protein [Halpernia sp.]|uniref:hypothetical protein n=1 Tax=Halpernia sp. TaxID=2782209 RepID=UPI003A8D26BA